MSSAAPVVEQPGRLARTLAAFRAQARMDMAFGGAVAPGATSLTITDLCGARSSALANLVVRSGAGLGGKSLVLGRPVSVSSYHRANGITHIYDHAVRQEHLETVAALPIVVEGATRLVIYLASRAQVGLGDRWFDGFTPMIRRLERDIAVEDEVRRRLALARPEPEPTLSPADLHDIARELQELTGQVEDDALRARLEAVSERLESREERRTAALTATVHLSPREVDVLAQVARGCSNQEAADNLGLLPNTVKSYLKTAMRKLQATNRVQAITAAREAGVLR